MIISQNTYYFSFKTIATHILKLSLFYGHCLSNIKPISIQNNVGTNLLSPADTKYEQKIAFPYLQHGQFNLMIGAYYRHIRTPGIPWPYTVRVPCGPDSH